MKTKFYRVCMYCKKSLGPPFFAEGNYDSDEVTSHGICDECFKIHFPKEAKKILDKN